MVRCVSICVLLVIIAGVPASAVLSQERQARRPLYGTAADRLLSMAFDPGGFCLSDAATRPAREGRRRAGRVRVIGHSLVDDGGPFLGLGVSYFTALWRCRNDRERLESDLAFLSGQGFNYYRMLSMVGWYPAWDGLEIAPTPFTSRSGKRVDAWPDYWQQLRELIDLAYDRYAMLTQVTVFADAQLMPNKREHSRLRCGIVGLGSAACSSFVLL